MAMFSHSKKNRHHIAVEKWTIDIASLWKLTIIEVYQLQSCCCCCCCASLKSTSGDLFQFNPCNDAATLWRRNFPRFYKNKAFWRALLQRLRISRQITSLDRSGSFFGRLHLRLLYVIRKCHYAWPMIDNNISFYINKEEVNIPSFSNIFLWRVLLPCWKMTKQFIWRGMWQLFSPFTRNVFLSKDLPKKDQLLHFFWLKKWYGQTDEQGILDIYIEIYIDI